MDKQQFQPALMPKFGGVIKRLAVVWICAMRKQASAKFDIV